MTYVINAQVVKNSGSATRPKTGAVRTLWTPMDWRLWAQTQKYTVTNDKLCFKFTNHRKNSEDERAMLQFSSRRKVSHLQVIHCSWPCRTHVSQNSPAPFVQNVLLSNTIKEANAMCLKSLHMSVNLQRWAELKRHASQYIVARHQQQSFAINFLQHQFHNLWYLSN